MDTRTQAMLKVIKRDKTTVSFTDDKIRIAIESAFLNTLNPGKDDKATIELIHEKSKKYTAEVVDALIRDPEKTQIFIEDIQNQVELVLMRAGEHEVASSYVIYRQKRKEERAESTEIDSPVIQLADGSTLSYESIEAWLKKKSEASPSLIAIHDLSSLVNNIKRNVFIDISHKELNQTVLLCARELIEIEPEYRFLTARILMSLIYCEILGVDSIFHDEVVMIAVETNAFWEEQLRSFIEDGIDSEILNPEIKSFNLSMIAAAIKSSHDNLFDYRGLQIIYDRYLTKVDGRLLELPQIFFCRVAMGMALLEDKKNEYAVRFYEVLSSTDYMSSTPTLFNSALQRSQLSSCYVTTIPDDLDDIFMGVRDNALFQKGAGGLGNDYTNVRGAGAKIKGTNGISSGVIPFLKVVDVTAAAVNQGGKRPGSVCAYLETWHIDIQDFLQLRKSTGEELRRTHNMDTANWIPDLFMERVFKGEQWTLFSPDEVTDLHGLYGDNFKIAYEKYEELAANGKINIHKTVDAGDLWREMITMLFETGHPWITFKDPCNLRSPQQHCGVIHSSNLCTEITLNTSNEEVAVCNLGSINLKNHLNTDGSINKEKLRKTVFTAIRMLDNVIDNNVYPDEKAENSNLKHRPIGLGIMGFQDVLHINKTPYDSEEALQLADMIQETISYFAIEASCGLAKERGAYESFEGSLWSKGTLPIDTLEFVKQYRNSDWLNDHELHKGLNLEMEANSNTDLDWEALREKVKTHGMRNSNCMAIAPTATIANICGVSSSIEPTYSNIYVKSNLSGEFVDINQYLVNDLKELGLWNKVLLNEIKACDGSIQSIAQIPDDIKRRYKTVFEIDQSWLVLAAYKRQKWIDQGQSLNLYFSTPSGKLFDYTYKMAWLLGLKTTYYLRSLGSTGVEKNQETIQRYDEEPGPSLCSIADPSCESCT